VGPAVLVYPDGIWYYNVKPDDVAEIVDEHLVKGKPVERLLAVRLGSGHARG
jgi:(2Fe-2S) ferredoxin